MNRMCAGNRLPMSGAPATDAVPRLKAELARLGTALQKLDAALDRAKKPTVEHEVVGLVLTPVAPDGKSGGDVVKVVRVGPAERQMYAPPRPYFATHDATRTEERVPLQETSDDELQELRLEEKRLQAIIDNPASRPDEKASAEIQLSQVRVLIQQKEVAAAGPTSTGMTAASALAFAQRGTATPKIRYVRDAHGRVMGAEKIARPSSGQ